MNLCQTLWDSYDALKQAYSDAEGLLNGGKKLSIKEYKETIEKLSNTKDEFNNSFYTNLPDGRKIYTLDYLSLIQLCYDHEEVDISQVLANQDDRFLNDEFRIISLNLYFLRLKTLDVSSFYTLTYLNCSNNQLKSLDVTKNTALTQLDCSNNQLPSLDLQNNTALTKLFCINNQLTSLDLQYNFALTRLDCNSNQITSLLSLSNISKLGKVIASHNPLDIASLKLVKDRGWII